MAVGFMQTSLAAHPDSPDLRLLLARALISEHRYEEARAQFEGCSRVTRTGRKPSIPWRSSRCNKVTSTLPA